MKSLSQCGFFAVSAALCTPLKLEGNCTDQVLPLYRASKKNSICNSLEELTWSCWGILNNMNQIWGRRVRLRGRAENPHYDVAGLRKENCVRRMWGKLAGQRQTTRAAGLPNGTILFPDKSYFFFVPCKDMFHCFQKTLVGFTLYHCQKMKRNEGGVFLES